tara:strand:+ start:385 stop:858 length:474 start_codon:yes stop_codon:yes gene_type:complete
MFEQFENESKEMKTFCKKNNLKWFYSGGGFVHYQLVDGHFEWLFNLYNEEEESDDIPKSPNDICLGGLWMEYALEDYFNSIGMDCNYDIETQVRDFCLGLKIDKNNGFDDLIVYNGGLRIENKKLKDMIPLIKKINKEILLFLDSDQKQYFFKKENK